MKILLQDSNTKLYLGRGGIWTNQPDAALAFLDEVRAKDYRIYHRLLQAQVVCTESSMPETAVQSAPAPQTLPN